MNVCVAAPRRLGIPRTCSLRLLPPLQQFYPTRGKHKHTIKYVNDRASKLRSRKRASKSKNAMLTDSDGTIGTIKVVSGLERRTENMQQSLELWERRKVPQKGSDEAKMTDIYLGEMTVAEAVLKYVKPGRFLVGAYNRTTDPNHQDAKKFFLVRAADVEYKMPREGDPQDISADKQNEVRLRYTDDLGKFSRCLKLAYDRLEAGKKVRFIVDPTNGATHTARQRLHLWPLVIERAMPQTAWRTSISKIVGEGYEWHMDSRQKRVKGAGLKTAWEEVRPTKEPYAIRDEFGKVKELSEIEPLSGEIPPELRQSVAEAYLEAQRAARVDARISNQLHPKASLSSNTPFYDGGEPEHGVGNSESRLNPPIMPVIGVKLYSSTNYAIEKLRAGWTGEKETDRLPQTLEELRRQMAGEDYTDMQNNYPPDELRSPIHEALLAHVAGPSNTVEQKAVTVRRVLATPTPTALESQALSSEGSGVEIQGQKRVVPSRTTPQRSDTAIYGRPPGEAKNPSGELQTPPEYSSLPSEFEKKTWVESRPVYEHFLRGVWFTQDEYNRLTPSLQKQCAKATKALEIRREIREIDYVSQSVDNEKTILSGMTLTWEEYLGLPSVLKRRAQKQIFERSGHPDLKSLRERIRKLTEALDATPLYQKKKKLRAFSHSALRGMFAALNRLSKKRTVDFRSLKAEQGMKAALKVYQKKQTAWKAKLFGELAKAGESPVLKEAPLSCVTVPSYKPPWTVSGLGAPQDMALPPVTSHNSLTIPVVPYTKVEEQPTIAAQSSSSIEDSTKSPPMEPEQTAIKNIKPRVQIQKEAAERRAKSAEERKQSAVGQLSGCLLEILPQLEGEVAYKARMERKETAKVSKMQIDPTKVRGIIRAIGSSGG